jgi:isopenicillin N synthase-like dioxygenase
MPRVQFFFIIIYFIRLHLEMDYFEKYFSSPTCYMRILHYPPQPNDSELLRENGEKEIGIGIGEHTDYGFLTILQQVIDHLLFHLVHHT